MQVFISHASADKATADAVCAGLEARGLKCWIAPRDISAGVDFPHAILEAINTASAMVLVYSRSTSASEHVAREVERAISKKIRLMPLRLGGAQPAGMFEYLLSTTHWLDTDTTPSAPQLDALAESLRRPRSTTLPTAPGRPAIWIGALTLLVAAAGLLAWRFMDRSPSASAAGKSIAVLPFENLSDDKSNAYFASGIQDEILTRLAGISTLKVISRTSTEKYQSHPDNLKAIARDLGVTTLLEGSVQKLGDAVHINLQLIDAATDTHLWAQSYDRKLQDVFAVEAEIATTVADSLKLALLPKEAARLTQAPTANAAAYDAFLRGEYALHSAWIARGDLETNLKDGDAAYAEAIARDPGFALAFVGRANLQASNYYLHLADGKVEPHPELLAQAKLNLDRALQLAPDLAAAHAALGRWYDTSKDLEKATAELHKAIALDPGLTDACLGLAWIELSSGRPQQAVERFESILERDPRNVLVLRGLHFAHEQLRQHEKAREAISRAAALEPDDFIDKLNLAFVTFEITGDRVAATAAFKGVPAAQMAQSQIDMALSVRDFQGAATLLAQAGPESFTETWTRPTYQGQVYEGLGRVTQARRAFLEAKALLEERIAKFPDQPVPHANLAYVLAHLGEGPAAVAEAERALAIQPVASDAYWGAVRLCNLAAVHSLLGQADAALPLLEELMAKPYGLALAVEQLKRDRDWDPLRKDPRFVALIARYEAAAKP